MEIKTIGVIGAGTMGNGIAQVAAESGYNVIMRDIEEPFVERGLKAIRKNLNRALEKGKKTEEEVAKAIDRIEGTVDLAALSVADLIIEAAVEKMELKKKILTELDELCDADIIFASNTSGLSITEMASVTGRAERVIGMHFFNPVPVMRLSLIHI